MTPDSILTQTKRLLREFNLTARKRLGQHFLVSGQVLNKIIAAADLAPDDVVIEVGPGLGILTADLAQKAGSVVAVELDDNLAVLLKKKLSDYPNLTIINEDILKLDPAALLAPVPGFKGSYKVVADLPYYITSPVLRHFLEAPLKPKLLITMVQKEVAQAIAAGAGERSVLSVMVQYYGKPRIVSYVPPNSFHPPPEVDSAILRIDVYPHPPVPVSDEKGFFKLVQAGFTARRKQFANSLEQGLRLPKSDVLKLLSQGGIDPRRRAETLTIEEWAKLWQAFSSKGET